MKRKSRTPVFGHEPEQRHQDRLAATGTRNSAGEPEEHDAEDGKREAVPPARARACEAVDRAASARRSRAEQRRHEVRAVLRRARAAASRRGTACVATQQTVIMLAYSAMKKAANFMDAVFGVEAGDQFVLRFRQIERDAVGFGERRRSGR